MDRNDMQEKMVNLGCDNIWKKKFSITKHRTMRCLTQLSTFSLSLRGRRCQNCKIAPPPSYSSLSHEPSLTSQLLSILETRSTRSLFRSLDLTACSPQLTPHVISTVLSHPIPFPSSFYFYTWASSFRHLDSWRSHDLTVSILQSNIKKFDSFSLLDDIKASLNRPISSFAFVVLFRAYAESGLIEDALEVFKRMPKYNSRPGTFAFNTILDVLVKKGAIFLAMGIYNQMAKAGIPPNKATFCILIQGFCKAGMFDDALKLLDEMENKGLKPDELIYTIILSAYCRMKLINEAESVFDSMKKSGCMIDSVVCQAMLSGYCRLGRMDVAFHKLKEYEEKFGFIIKLEGYCSLIDGLFKAKKFDNACSVYKDMLEKNVEPNCFVYTVMIRGFLEVRRVKEALGFFNEMIEKGMVPNTYCYHTLIKGLCDWGYVEKARSLMLSMYKHGLFPDSITYSIMISGLCKQGHVHDARQIFNEMSEFGIVPNINSYNSLIDGLCKAEMFDGARYLFDKMNLKPSLVLRLPQGLNRGANYTYILRKKVEELCERGYVVEAYKLLEGIMDGVVPDVVTFNVQIDGLFKGGKPNEALQLLKMLKFFGIKPNEFTYCIVINGLLEIGRIDEALNNFQCMSKDMIVPNLPLCRTIMKLHCAGKKIMEAIMFWLNHISTTWPTNEVCKIKVIKDHFEQGHIEVGVEKLIEWDIEHDSVNSSPYTIWLIGFCQARKIDEAIKIFKTLVKFDIEVTLPACVILISNLCREWKLAHAFDVMLYALRRGFMLDQSVGDQLLRKLCLDNKKKEAHELLCRMSLAGYDMKTYLLLPTKRLLYDHR